MHHEYALLTPEKVAISYRVAGLGSRVLAHLMDLLIAGSAFGAIIFALSMMVPVLGQMAMAPIMMVMSFGLLTYFTLFEGLWNGQTPGKKAFQLRVRNQDGTPVTVGSALFRNLLRPADLVPGIYLVGLGAIFVTPLSQRIGDLAAGTIVVHEPRALPRFSLAPHRFGVHPFESAIGDLSKMTQEEYFAIKRACDRYPELAGPVQERLLREIWAPFAARHRVANIPDVHPVYLMEAIVMRYGRQRGLL